MNKYQVTICISLFFLTLLSCTDKKQNSMENEDKQAKELLQGLWTDEDGTTPVIMVRGDSIFYPDSASMPALFWIYKDTIYLKGQNVNGYKITKQAPHYFAFKNQNGDDIGLAKSQNKLWRKSFSYYVFAVNTFEEQISDTITHTDAGYFESKVHISTTSDQVIKTTYNESGIEVDNLYLDNVASVSLTNHGKLVYAHDFRKQEFARHIPSNFLSNCILRKFYFTHADRNAFYYDAIIGIPDADTGYVIEVRITPEGKVSQRLK